MPKKQFKKVTNWVFDLDHTLYAPDHKLFSQIEHKMTLYIMDTLGLDADEANKLRHRYWNTYGTTLAGLMEEHRIDPVPFLWDVHQIDFSVLKPNPLLGAAISALPGRKIVYTNGTIPYAKEALLTLQISTVFDAIYGVESAGYRPKPQRKAFETVFSADNTNTKNGAMFEDDQRNLVIPKKLGMRTVLVTPSCESVPPHVDFITSDLTTFLRQIV
ncbi:MAG: pyrimidine 5'-nucleotidase [Rhodobacteraceae bacterium]|nr:pyrimidine 5'-nucleotidase [Paracoccaceae bacterium]